MRHRLRPVAPRRGRLPITLATLLFPVVGLILMSGLDSVRQPFSEGEAFLAVAVRPPSAIEAQAISLDARAPSSMTIALSRIGPRLMDSREFSLRFVGIVIGAFALGFAVRLGERLFTNRMGVMTAGLLLALPAGRALIGERLGVEPFLVCVMLYALTEIRNLSNSRDSLAHASTASGVALALAGPALLWLPVMILSWLRRLYGLDRESFARVTAWTIGGGLVASWLPWALIGSGGMLGGPLLGWAAAPAGPWAAESIQPIFEFLLLAPLTALGIYHLPKNWGRSVSLRFVVLWISLSCWEFAFAGSVVGPTLGAIFLCGAFVTWGVDRLRKKRAPLVAVVALLCAIGWITSSFPSAGDGEGWAARETGRFVKRALDRDSTVGAVPDAEHRLTYYGRRAFDAIETPNALPSSVDYVVLSREEAARASTRPTTDSVHPEQRDPLPRDILVRRRPLRVLAEIGPWIVGRVRIESAQPKIDTPEKRL